MPEGLEDVVGARGRHPLDHLYNQPANGERSFCSRVMGYTPLVTESAGVSYLNPGAQIVTKLMCNQCGAVLDTPPVDHPTQRPGLRRA